MQLRICDGCRAQIEQDKMASHPRGPFSRDVPVQMMMPIPVVGSVDGRQLAPSAELKEVDLCSKCVNRLAQWWEENKAKNSQVKLGAPFPGA
jgi:hypothetical protein